MRFSLGSLSALVAVFVPFASADCDISCVGICYNDYFGVMDYGHSVFVSAAGPGSINGWPKFYTTPANSSVDEAASGPWAAFPILRDTTTELYDGTQEITGIVTWGEYGTSYETSNVIDYGVNNGFVQTDCGGPDDD